MTDPHHFQVDERIRRAHELRPEASARILDLWPSIESTLTEERPVVVRRRRMSRRRVLLVAIAIALILGAAVAVGGPLRHIFWDSENAPTTDKALDPNLAASQLLAGRYARDSDEPSDRAPIAAMVARNDPDYMPQLVPGAPVRVVEASKIDRRLVFVETRTGGFCFEMHGGQVGLGGCSGDFGSNGVKGASGAISGTLVLEGFVANDVTRIQMQLRSGELEEVPIDHGLFAWSEGHRPASRQAVGFIATRAGKLVHQRFPLDPSLRRPVSR